jgi:membrane protease YdiL (CAAX protease family)
MTLVPFWIILTPWKMPMVLAHPLTWTASWGAPRGMPIAVVLAVWLLSLSPGAVTFSVCRRAGIGAERRLAVHLAVCALMVAVDAILFGPPGHVATSPAACGAGIGAGGLYYGIERLRLEIAHRDELRTSRRSEWTPLQATPGAHGLWAGAGSLTVVAAAEELLFRWYALAIPLAYGLFGTGICVAVSVLGYAVLHHEIGVGTMISRGLAGLAAVAVVLGTGQLVAVILAHVTYNICVYLRPVQYLRVREASRP